MKFFTIAAALLGVTTALPSLVQRDFGTQNASINTVSSSYKQFNSTVASFEPTSLNTLSGLTAIQSSSQQLEKDLQSAIDALSGSQLSLFDSISLLLTRLAFEPVLLGYLIFMISMKPKFDSVLGVFSVRKTILAILERQDDLTQQVDKRIQAVMHPVIAPGMTAIALAEHLAFEVTEGVYEVPAPAGRIELPAGQLPDASAVTGALQ